MNRGMTAQEMRQQESEASEAEAQAQALAAARASLSSSLEAPSAAHPVESYGEGKLSLAQARRKISRCAQGILGTKEALTQAPLNLLSRS